MARKTLESDRLLTVDDDFRVASVSSRRRRRRGKRTSPSPFRETFSPETQFYCSEPGRYSLMRTRRLLMAALKVWELKNGFHSPY